MSLPGSPENGAKADPPAPATQPAEEEEEEDNEISVPGQDDNDGTRTNKWQNFESQYSIAIEQANMIEREHWGSKWEFLASSIASAVGLGNIWRFPFIAAQNGGGAFLIPYLIVMTLIGRPLFMIELSLGQFCSAGPIKIWELCPGFRGVGYLACLASFLTGTFYCVIMGWAVLYFYYSFFPVFPWDVLKDNSTTAKVYDSPTMFFVFGHLQVPADPSASQWAQGTGLDGPPVIHLVMALLISWTLVWGVMVMGVSGSGKIAYFTSIFPYVLLMILMIAGCTLPGAFMGLKHFFVPDLSYIIKPKTWFVAVGQVFFSLGVSFGGCIMFSSYNQFNHKIGRDILIISIMDTITSIVAGVCLFALLGNIALSQGINVDELATPGAGMAFAVFPQVLQAFGPYPFPQMFSVFFFFMIMVLAVGSANGLVGTSVTVICDGFPTWKRSFVVTGMCVVSFFLGLIYCTPSGTGVLDIVDRHGSELIVFVVSLFEVIGILWIYGMKNLCNDIEFMQEKKLSNMWYGLFGCLPFFLIVIFLANFIVYTRDPSWSTVAYYCAWGLTVVCVLVIPISMIAVIFTRKSASFRKKFVSSFYHTRRFGPSDPAIREAWRRWKKTKPTEFDFWGKLMVSLRLRKVDYVPSDPKTHWKDNAEVNDNASNATTVSVDTVDKVSLEPLVNNAPAYVTSGSDVTENGHQNL